MGCHYKLKDCPFCGGEAIFKITANISNHTTVGYHYSIVCSKCGCTPFSKDTQMEICMSQKDGSLYPTGVSQVRQQKLVDEWNTRTQKEG